MTMTGSTKPSAVGKIDVALAEHLDVHHDSYLIIQNSSNNNIKKKQRCNNTKAPRFELYVVLLLVVFFYVTSDSNLFENGAMRHLSLESSIISTDKEKLPAPVGRPEKRWSDVKLAVYMTTHLPPSHINFLPCWYDAVRRMKIFQNADLILYTSSFPTPGVLLHLAFQNVTIKLYKNTGYQSGAIQAMIDPFVDTTDLWFAKYDWVIRLNPDVLVRNDTWLIQTMLNTSVDAIVHDCRNRKLFLDSNNDDVLPTFHTDFTAFRPSAIDRNLLLAQDKSNAEIHYTNAIRNIYNSSRFAYVQGANNSIPGHCRIEGEDSPILHVHDFHQFCPYYYNATKKGVY